MKCKKQVNNESRTALNRDFPRQSRSRFITEAYDEYH